MKRTYVTYTIKLSEKKTSAPPKKSSKNYSFLLQEQKPTKKVFPSGVNANTR